MSLALATIEYSEARHRLFYELAYAIKQTDAKDMMRWGKVSASRIPKVGARRLKNLGKLAFSLTNFLSNEASLVSDAWKEKQLGGHLASRTSKGIESTFETGVKVCRFTTAMAVALRDDPKKNASTVLAFALGFFVGSGGLDGNGGIPDTDIAMFGIGNHRSILTHSVIAGIFVECSILALADLAGIVCDKLPQNKRSPFWDKISTSKDAIAQQLCVGASTGIAYHLAVDATIQPAAYKDLPLSMPMEAHQSVFALNAIAEGNDGLQRQKDRTILANGGKTIMKAEDHINEMKKSANDAVPIFERFLSAAWNLLMNVLVSIGFMPLFKKYPWLFAVMMFFTMAAFIPLGILLIAMGVVAHSKGVKSSDNFIISFKNDEMIQNHGEEREAMVDEAFLRTIEMGYPQETAAKVSEGIGKLYDKNQEKEPTPLK